jgi:hypothetical protein
MTQQISPAVEPIQLTDVTSLSDLVKLSAKRTRAVFLTESGNEDLGGLERA